ncbi:FAD-binding protein, partial [Candidatus Hadarchaeum sp.]|uniref:FAD-binding protein n=1 Tax=Candidatus Hadarchaeum sp. TaxID=2883567 RepID=UPI00319E38DD
MEQWELVIIGAGPAGLTAGLYGVRSGLKTLVIEEKRSRHRPASQGSRRFRYG